MGVPVVLDLVTPSVDVTGMLVVMLLAFTSHEVMNSKIRQITNKKRDILFIEITSTEIIIRTLIDSLGSAVEDGIIHHERLTICKYHQVVIISLSPE
jgi:hypothetical protein